MISRGQQTLSGTAAGVVGVSGPEARAQAPDVGTALGLVSWKGSNFKGVYKDYHKGYYWGLV